MVSSEINLVKRITNLNSDLRQRLYGGCFSENYDDDYSWSEYVDRKKGFVVEYTLIETDYAETEKGSVKNLVYFH
jgi:hypothetical protein